MEDRPTPRMKVTRTRVVVLALVVAAGFTISAAAATMPSPPDAVISVLADDVTVTIPSTELAFDDFSGCHNGLDGWSDSLGNVWQSHSGNWQCLGNGVVRAQQRVTLGNATVEVSQWDGSSIRISTAIDDVSHQNNRSGPGIALFGDGGGGMTYVTYERDLGQITIGLAYPTANQIIDEITGIADHDALTLSVDVVGSTIGVAVDGVGLGSYDLASTGAGPYLGSKRFGLTSDNDNQSRFNNFTIELLP